LNATNGERIDGAYTALFTQNATLNMEVEDIYGPAEQVSLIFQFFNLCVQVENFRAISQK
jgi:hypothetical protein